MRVVIAGVAGVGKSTVLAEIKKGTSYDIINFGTLMYEMAKSLELVQSRDDIRHLNVETQMNLQKKAANAIGQMDNVIIDTHMSMGASRNTLNAEIPYSFAIHPASLDSTIRSLFPVMKLPIILLSFLSSVASVSIRVLKSAMERFISPAFFLKK